jgi:hypothetical protein
VGDEALDRAIDTLKQTERPSRQKVDTQKVKENKASGQKSVQ